MIRGTIKIKFWSRFCKDAVFTIFVTFLIEIQRKYDEVNENRRRGALPETSGDPTPQRLQEVRRANIFFNVHFPTASAIIRGR